MFQFSDFLADSVWDKLSNFIMEFKLHSHNMQHSTIPADRIEWPIILYFYDVQWKMPCSCEFLKLLRHCLKRRIKIALSLTTNHLKTQRIQFTIYTKCCRVQANAITITSTLCNAMKST